MNIGSMLISEMRKFCDAYTLRMWRGTPSWPRHRSGNQRPTTRKASSWLPASRLAW